MPNTDSILSCSGEPIEFTTADIMIRNIMDSATGVSFALYVAVNFGFQVLNVEALEAAVKVPV